MVGSWGLQEHGARCRCRAPALLADLIRRRCGRVAPQNFHPTHTKPKPSSLELGSTCQVTCTRWRPRCDGSIDVGSSSMHCADPPSTPTARQVQSLPLGGRNRQIERYVHGSPRTTYSNLHKRLLHLKPITARSLPCLAVFLAAQRNLKIP